MNDWIRGLLLLGIVLSLFELFLSSFVNDRKRKEIIVIQRARRQDEGVPNKRRD
jgi:hypothetical protein